MTLSIRPAAGPHHAVASQPGNGLEPGRVLYWALSAEPQGAISRAVLDSALVGRIIDEKDELSYDVFPELDETQANIIDAYASTAVAIDLVFEDDTSLTTIGVLDQHGVHVDPLNQYESKTLQAGQWNRKRVALDRFVGSRVARVELVTAAIRATDERADVSGYIGRTRIDPGPAVPADAVDRVRTTRGTHSAFAYSRGNTAPLVAMPHGATFATPVTDARTDAWIYTYAAHNREDAQPAIQAFATSHIPSPWIRDRGILQLMPTLGPLPLFDPRDRATAFSHEHEEDRPYRYAVSLDNGIQAELTAGQWSMLARFTFPHDQAWLIIDQVDENGALFLPAGDRTFSGCVDGDGESPRMFFSAVMSRPVISARRDADSTVRGAVQVALTDNRTLTIAVGTSFLSAEQARRNLAFDLDEVSDGQALDEPTIGTATFDRVADRARKAWQERLDLVGIDGATPDQLTSVASSLYRLFLYPNQSAENVGTRSSPRYQYASPFHPLRRAHTPTATGCRIVDGHLSVNHGFWDTYRTVWPALQLLRPADAGELLDGFVQHYRDGGWTSRWSAPGPIDNMTGTTTDVIVASAVADRLPTLEPLDAYDSALRNATVPASDPRVGRKGVRSQTFRGFTDTRVSEGMSWTIDSAINDFGIAQLAETLRELLPPSHHRQSELAADAAYYRARAARYATVFDDRIGFFQGRNDDGSWRVPDPAAYDPEEWGTDYTETNGWGTAFTAPHDGNGLVALHGGPAALEARLDAFFATPETGREEHKGNYDIAIHEMAEARDVRMGMLGLSNQPAHHIPFMYAFTGAHHKTQAIVSEALHRLFLGSEIGQGYPGDEDNGEMSAWYLLAALGLYPLVPGSRSFVFTTPLFRQVQLALPSGSLTIRREGADSDTYIDAVTVDGVGWNHIEISKDRLVNAREIVVFTAGSPTDWASASTPTSLTPPGQRPMPRLDLTDPAQASQAVNASVGRAAHLFDDRGDAVVPIGRGDHVAWDFAEPTYTSLYTVTSQARTASWLLEGREANGKWTQLDRQTETAFLWQGQTRPFLIMQPRGYVSYRLTAITPLRLQQIEFLADA